MRFRVSIARSSTLTSATPISLSASCIAAGLLEAALAVGVSYDRDRDQQRAKQEAPAEAAFAPHGLFVIDVFRNAFPVADNAAVRVALDFGFPNLGHSKISSRT
jgi:hypothetical protein